MPPVPSATRSLLAELDALEARLDLADAHRLAVTAAEVTVVDLEADLALVRVDRLAGRLPDNARRPLSPAERASRVDLPALDRHVDEVADRLTAAMIAARQEVADELADLLEQAAAGVDVIPGLDAGAPPTHRMADVMRALDDPAMPLDIGAGPTARLTAYAAAELGDTTEEGYRRVLREAFPDLPATTGPDMAAGDLAAHRDRAAARIGSEPARHARELATAAFYELPVFDLEPGEVLTGLRDATAAGSTARLRDVARPEVHKLHGLGRQQAADTLAPVIAYVYASELLDRNTCSPCSRADGLRYATLAEARLDYPEGRYRRCEGGRRCRGTLVYVWSDEATPTVDSDPVTPLPEDPPTAPAAPPAPPRPPVDPQRAADDSLIRRDKATLTKAEQAERARALRRRHRRNEQEQEAANRDPDVIAAALERYGITREQYEQARRALPAVKTSAKIEARAVSHEKWPRTQGRTGEVLPRIPPKAQRVQVGGRKALESTADSSWDWFELLPADEQKRFRRWMGDEYDGLDLYAEDWQKQWAVDASGSNAGMTVDQVMAEVVDATRYVDGAKALDAGHAPSYIDANDLAPEVSAELGGLDVAVLFGNEVDAAASLAAAYAERAAVDAARLLRPGSKLGPDPWRMTPDTYREELLDLEARIGDARTYGRPTNPADTERWWQLIPDGLDTDVDGALLSPAALYDKVMDLARAAGYN